MHTNFYTSQSLPRQMALLLTLLLAFTLAQAQTNSRNYVWTRTFTTESQSTFNDQIEYFDGLGRPVQQVLREASPQQRDIVSLQEYDLAGRESHTWLPTPQSTATYGAFIAPATLKTQAWAFYADSAYSRPVYEDSPLGRVAEHYHPGREWYNNRKSVRTQYLTNNQSDTLICARYSVSDNGETLSKSGSYATGTLQVTRVEDEAGHTTLMFTDGQDRLILSRQIDRQGTTKVKHDTYYVYDTWNNLCFVLPPLAADALTADGYWDETNTTLRQYAYIYRYDQRNRRIYKKLPGAEPVLSIYDQADRLIFTQDGERRQAGEWLFTIPDMHGRTVLTGICKNQISDANYLSGTIVEAAYDRGGTTYLYYTLGAGLTLTAPVTLLEANYYDSHAILDKPEFSSLGYVNRNGYTGQRYGDRNEPFTTNGLLTGRAVAVLDGSSPAKYTYEVFYYNTEGAVVQKQATNLLGGKEQEFCYYDFTGKPLRRFSIHTATGKPQQTEEYTYTYDHAGRLTQTKHSLNGAADVILAKNNYDERGRLSSVLAGGWDILRAAYTYNVRSWVTQNTGTHYQENLTYTYNGNIRKKSWTLNNQPQTYTYTYDHLSRLLQADYTGSQSAGTKYTYDKQGNLLTLQRSGPLSATSGGILDNLTFSYTGNQLRYVNDAGPNGTYNGSMDFKDYTKGTGVEYIFNANGAMTKDLNKGISSIAYNYLNLPRTLDMKNPVAEARNTYTYSADGILLSKLQQWNAAPSASATPGSAVDPAALNQSLRTDYVGNKVYENGTLKRILVDNGYIENGQYHFYVKDYLGNNVVTTNHTGQTVSQRQSYYPFGASVADVSLSQQQVQPYKYNAKELDSHNGLNLYDYHARQYDPALGRFTTMDPLAEQYYSTSPYAYCANNPVRYIDPTGMAWRPTYDTADGVEVINGYEWIEEEESYNEDGTLKAGLYTQAIFFSTNWGNKAFNKNSNKNMGSSTATVYLADGTTTTFDATTQPANEDIHATVPEGFYEADFGTHRGNPALNMRDRGTKKGSRRIELGRIHPSDPNRTYAEYINIHWAGKKNVTGEYTTGKYVSEGCLLIDINSWNSFINIFSTKEQRKNVVGVGVSRTLSIPVNKKD